LRKVKKGLRAFFLRFATKAAEPSAKRFARSMLLRSGSKRFARSMQQSCVQSPSGVQVAFGRSKVLRSGKIEIS